MTQSAELAAAEDQTERREVIVDGDRAAADGFPAGVGIRALVSAQCGARGICTARADFAPGAEAPCHIHDCGEAITVVNGAAVVRVEGRRYELGAHDCIFVPAGLRHSVAYRGAGPARLPTAFASEQPSRTYVDEPGPDAAGKTESLIRFAESTGYELSSNTDFHDLFAGQLMSTATFGSARVGWAQGTTASRCSPPTAFGSGSSSCPRFAPMSALEARAATGCS